jgi:hypothetical protein
LHVTRFDTWPSAGISIGSRTIYKSEDSETLIL